MKSETHCSHPADRSSAKSLLNLNKESQANLSEFIRSI